QRTLVAVEHREVQRVSVGNVAQLVARHVARARTLDLDHVRTEPRKQLRARRAGLYVRKVDDLDAFEGFVAHSISPGGLGLTSSRRFAGSGWSIGRFRYRPLRRSLH